MTAVSTDRTDFEWAATAVSAVCNAGLSSRPVVMVQPTANGVGHQLPIDGLVTFELGRRIRNPQSPIPNPLAQKRRSRLRSDGRGRFLL